MATIAQTKRYQELRLRFKRLKQLYSVMSELRLHTNLNVDEEAARYYKAVLYDWGDYGHFLNASLNAMMQVFYIELEEFIGGYWDSEKNKVSPRDNDKASLAVYLYDNTRITRKKSAQLVFEKLLQEKSTELYMIHKLRGGLAHFAKLKKRNELFAPSDKDIREILNGLAEVQYLLGYHPWNKPDYIQIDNDFSTSTKNVVDSLTSHNKNSVKMRQQYDAARDKWYGQ